MQDQDVITRMFLIQNRTYADIPDQTGHQKKRQHVGKQECWRFWEGFLPANNFWYILVVVGIQVSMRVIFISWPGEMTSNSRSIARNFNAAMG